ncbi:hypothetical protein ACQRBN_12250 [Bariatricus sp. SGI.154]|uniref:hypothetical protein n=1 Tax=Bariatricus sp. SGI.154 TaxID=3420549 RepID=UPI003D069A39
MDELEELKKSILEAFEEMAPEQKKEDLADIFLQLSEEINEDTKDDDSDDFIRKTIS